MVTLTLRETTAERLRKLARARGLTVEETLDQLLEQADDRTQRQLAGIRALSGMLDIPDTDLAENDERLLHDQFRGGDADSD